MIDCVLARPSELAQATERALAMENACRAEHHTCGECFKRRECGCWLVGGPRTDQIPACSSFIMEAVGRRELVKPSHAFLLSIASLVLSLGVGARSGDLVLVFLAGASAVLVVWTGREMRH